jgi:hypothetical protein
LAELITKKAILQKTVGGRLPEREEKWMYIEAFGMRHALCEWSEITGIPEDTLSKRLRTWSVEKALSTPLIKNKANKKVGLT